MHEQSRGPSQASPLSLTLEVSKPSKFWAVHNFSIPLNPSSRFAQLRSHRCRAQFGCLEALLRPHVVPNAEAHYRGTLLPSRGFAEVTKTCHLSVVPNSRSSWYKLCLAGPTHTHRNSPNYDACQVDRVLYATILLLKSNLARGDWVDLCEIPGPEPAQKCRLYSPLLCAVVPGFHARGTLLRFPASFPIHPL